MWLGIMPMRVLAALVALLFASIALAQDYPARTITLVVPYPPGGGVDAMERIVKRMLAAKTPIVVWVGPAGARAGSAGFFILMAADVAAMAPGTRAGAASVVNLFGKNEEGDIMLKKASQDAAALVRSIAEHRGRNVEACEKAESTLCVDCVA